MTQKTEIDNAALAIDIVKLSDALESEGIHPEDSMADRAILLTTLIQYANKVERPAACEYRHAGVQLFFDITMENVRTDGDTVFMSARLSSVHAQPLDPYCSEDRDYRDLNEALQDALGFGK